MTTIAIDPGVSTGIAINSDVTGYSTVVTKQPTDIWDIITYHNPTVVCIENFASGGIISRYGQETLRLVGAVELACYIQHIRLIIQFPAERLAFIDQARSMLKQIKPHPIIHEVDALAHLLLYEDRVRKGVLEKIVASRRKTYG